MKFWEKYGRYIKMSILVILYYVLMFTRLPQVLIGEKLHEILGDSVTGYTSYAIIFNVGIYLFLMALSLFLVPDIYYLDFKIYKKKTPSRRIIEVVIGVQVILIASLLGNSFTIFFGGNMDSANEQAIDSIVTAFGSWAFIPVAVVFGPIVEEIIFRGILQQSIIGSKFEKWSNPRVIIGIVVTSLLFGLIHVIDAGDYVQIFPYFFMGLALGGIAYQTKSIFPSALAHIFNNAMAILLPLLL